jgi:hypothetical protein
MPATYSRLINAGIKEDYSMGYGSINGFRASIVYLLNGTISKKSNRLS